MTSPLDEMSPQDAGLLGMSAEVRLLRWSSSQPLSLTFCHKWADPQSAPQDSCSPSSPSTLVCPAHTQVMFSFLFLAMPRMEPRSLVCQGSARARTVSSSSMCHLYTNSLWSIPGNSSAEGTSHWAKQAEMGGRAQPLRPEHLQNMQ